jgi:hypothetical protein
LRCPLDERPGYLNCFFTEISENRGLAPNRMAMPEATITGIPETKKLA